MQNPFLNLSAALLALLLAPLATAAPDQQVLCHYTYGGETRTLAASPVASPYAVETIAVGSYFHLRVVFQNVPASRASVKVYTYADGDDGPSLIHQAHFAYPPTGGAGSPYGFSGVHTVYETVRDGELQYWCELTQERTQERTPGGSAS